MAQGLAFTLRAYPDTDATPLMEPQAATPTDQQAAEKTAHSIPYYAADGSTLSTTSSLQILASGTASTTNATLNGTTTNEGTITGGVLDGYLKQNWTTITDSGYVGTNIPTNPTAGRITYTKIILTYT